MNKQVVLVLIFGYLCYLSTAFEVVDEGEGDEIVHQSQQNTYSNVQSNKPNNQKQNKKPEDATSVEEWNLLFDESDRVTHMTNNLYKQLYNDGAFNQQNNHWVFLFLHGEDKYLQSNISVLKWLKDLRTDQDILTFKDSSGSQEIESLRIAYIDMVNNGEQLKETFDVKRSPRFVFIKHNIQYPYTSKNNNLSYNDVVDLIKLKHKKPKAARHELRPLVEENMLIYEYSCTTIGNWFIDNDGPKYVNILKDDYQIDLAQFNENLGKKQWVKSQGRTVALMLGVLVAGLLTLLTMVTCCCCYCCCGKKNQVEKPKLD